MVISSFFDAQARGGAALSVQIVVQGLLERGHDVTVITTHAGRGLVRENVRDVTVYRLNPCNLYWIGNKNHQPQWKKVLWQLVDTWNPLVFRLVRGILEEEQPDIIHVNKLRGLSPSVWAAAALSVGVPTLQTCRDYELMSPQGTLTGRVGTWAKERHSLMRPYQWIRAECSRPVAAATAPSRYALDMLTTHGFFPEAAKFVIPNSHGLTVEQLDQRVELFSAGDSPSRTVRLLYLGRLEVIKGVDLLCAAFERCANLNPKIRLDIAGWGTLEPALRQRYGSHPRITFHGSVFGEKKARLLTRADAVIVPSTWPEVFGVVVAEAYAYGKPAIASRAGGIPEIVEDGVTGFLVPTSGVDTLAGALCHAIEKRSEMAAMAADCFRAARKYARDIVVDKYVSVYNQLLERTK